MKRILLGLFVVGCGANPPTPSRVIVATKPSESTTDRIGYFPPFVETVAKDGTRATWVPKKYQSDGEEKLVFEKGSVADEGDFRGKEGLIRIGGPKEDAEIFESMLVHLLRAGNRTQFPVSKHGFPPFGLTSDLYFGHTFWDMDVWMIPAFLFLSPVVAKGAANYRLDRVQQARQNYSLWMQKALARKDQAPGGMMFPWESSVSGKEVCIQKTRNQPHISGDVLWGLTQCEAMGLVEPEKVKKVADGVQAYYRARSASTGRGREILDVTSPNEKFEGNNDLYTNLLAEWTASDRHWPTKAQYYLPRDEKSFLNYDNDPMRDYQQAAGLLAIYPLQYPGAEREARAMMERFADKISPNGPAMGHSVVATIWARLGEPDKAYQAWLESWKPYTVGTNNYFSERRNANRPYFYTGAAGAINTVIYGFAGFRIDRIPLPGAKWTYRFKSGWWLSVKPCVPKEIGEVSFSGILIDGVRYDFRMTSDGGFSSKPTVP